MTAPGSALPRVLVCHPGRQHSHQLAMALAEHGMLAKYVTGSPMDCGGSGGKWRRLLQRVVRPYADSIGPGLVKQVYVGSVPRKVADKVLPPALALIVGHQADGFFDRYVSRFLSTVRPDAVVAYENSALHTFRRARQLGIKTVLDAASFHHRWQDRFYEPVEKESAHRRVTQHKDGEIALADHILTVSELARESYLEAGFGPERVTAIPVGVDAQIFHPSDRADLHATQGQVRFVFVGQLGHRKGGDVLCAAARRIGDAEKRFTLTTFGNVEPGFSADDLRGINRRDWIRHAELSVELPRHDVLVLPSRHDSFGMVVAEAMACGLSAIVSQNVGAREMITEGVNGLVVPAGEAVALAEAMQWFIAHAEDLPAMSRAARDSAERYDWANYRRRVNAFFTSI